MVDSDENDASAAVFWPIPHTADNSGEAVALTVIPAITSPRRFFIGVALIVYAAEDRARNRATCNFTVTVRGEEAKLRYLLLLNENYDTILGGSLT